jgi:hypothetical protein
MEVKVTEETLRFIGTIFVLQARHVVWSGMRRKEGNVLAALTCLYTRDTLSKFVVRLRIERYTLEMLAALETCEALGMKALASC